MNYWKIGSSWGGGKDKSVLPIFRRNEIVFVGKDTEKFRHIAIDDLIAIGEGRKIVAIAKVLTAPRRLSEITLRKNKNDYNIGNNHDNILFVRVKIVDIDDKNSESGEEFKYHRLGTIYKVETNSLCKRIEDEYNKNIKKPFDISSRTYRLFDTNKNDGKASLFRPENKDVKYIIPIYQREYSWGEYQIIPFLDSIVNGFREYDEELEEKFVLKKDPLFIGTMQLSQRHYISATEFEQDIIDGQQRTTTIICLLKFMELRYSYCFNLNDLFETRVNNGKEQELFDEMLDIKSIEILSSKSNTSNKYIKNLSLIKDYFCDKEENKYIDEHIDEFKEYISKDIYFVVVETVAGLSKTLQIFNTINTAGLDLNGEDLFKVKFYEYLRDKKDKGESAFNEIGNLYKRVKMLNEDWLQNHNHNLISMNNVLSVYKNYLIGKYQMPLHYLQMAAETFFERLFDTISGCQNYIPNISSDFSMSLEDISCIIDIVSSWNREKFKTHQQFIEHRIIKESRYSSANNLAYQILMFNKDFSHEEVYSLMGIVSRFVFCHSVKYQRQTNYVKSKLNQLYREIALKPLVEIINSLKKDLMSQETEMMGVLAKPIATNATWKNIICILSDYIHEIATNANITCKDLHKLYSKKVDIEHIHANANTNEAEGIIWNLQNGIGNLMLLEYDINRSIGDLVFSEKVSRSGQKKCYKDSEFASVKEICNHSKWGIEEIENRRTQEVANIMDFLFKKG